MGRYRRQLSRHGCIEHGHHGVRDEPYFSGSRSNGTVCGAGDTGSRWRLSCEPGDWPISTTNSAITAATRGEANYVAGSDYSKKTPTGCIGPDVYFSTPIATTASSKKMVYTFCNPDGYKGVAVT